MDQPPAPGSTRSEADSFETELLILPDGRVFAHNLTVPLHEVLSALSSSTGASVDTGATPLANDRSES